MDKHWSHYCTMSIVHFMAFPKTISGEGPIADSVAKIAEDPFFGAGEITWGKDRAAAVKSLVKSLKELCAYGRDKGVALTVETFDRDVDKKALIGPSPLAAEFAAAVRQEYPEFGLMYDLRHQPRLHEESQAALTTLKDHLVHI